MFDFFNMDTPNAMECLTSGKCSIDPRTVALSETFIYEIRQLTYYLLKIKEIGYENLSIVDSIITTLASINFGFTYRPKDIEDILTSFHKKREEVVDFYKNLCKKEDLDCQLLQSLRVGNDDLNIIKAIMTGERQSIKKNTQISGYRKNLYEIIIMMAKSASATISKLADYDILAIDERYKILEFLNSLNFLNIKEEKLARKIILFAKTSHELNQKLNRIYEERYSTPNIETVKFDRVKGKAILISGDNFNDLDLLLQATKNTGINIYTHDRMILAMQYPYFKQFDNIAGQYQRKDNNFPLDFADFPGPILLTRNYINKIESLYRGNIFSTDTISAKGITQIKNYDFAPLINIAKEMEGFLQSQKRLRIKMGYNSSEINSKLDDISDKINKEDYDSIYIVGLVNYGYEEDDFFEELYQKIGEDNFIISLAYEKNATNIFHIKSFFDFSLVYKIIQRLKENIDTDKHRIKVILTQCSKDSLTNLFILKNLGINDIYITCCNTNNLNPSIIECLKEQFNVKQLSDNFTDNFNL